MAEEKANSNKTNGKEEKAERGAEQRQDDPQKEMKEQMLRLAAEFDNYKKRSRQEMDLAKKVGKAEMLKNILPIVDEFELAMLAATKSEDKNVSKGIEMLYSNFIDVLKREGLSEINSNGKFDPYKHEILMAKESGEKDGTILEVVKKGYMFGDVLLRPSAVIVSNGKIDVKQN